MITFVLPGRSVQNKDWAYNASKALNLDHEVRPVMWEHWNHPEMPFDPKDKAKEIIEVAMNESINIVAKSVGTLVACYIIQAVPEKVEKLILCGIPLKDLTEEDKEAEKMALKNFPSEKIICYQNEEDPYASFDEVKDFLEKINPKIKMIINPRNDHEYPYYSEFRQFLVS